MLKSGKWWLVIAGLVLVVGLGLFIGNDWLPADRTKNGSLLNASNEEIAKAAIEFTRKIDGLIDGTPQILFNRRVTPRELREWGLSSSYVDNAAPPLQLVIMKGNFDGRGIFPVAPVPERTQPEPTPYIAYIYDLNFNFPNTRLGSGDGSMFRLALNDPTLPTPQSGTTLPPYPIIQPQLTSTPSSTRRP